MNKTLIDKLYREQSLSKEELLILIQMTDEDDFSYLCQKSNQKKEEIFGKSVYIRGLIEFTNYCKNDCYYCGIRCSNKKAERYRLSVDDILLSCEAGDKLGIQTYVLQGGEDPCYTDEKLIGIVTKIKEKYPKKAITLSVGERSLESYQKLKNAGVDRYLLRHETASDEHYKKLHPKNLTLINRINCLKTLKKLNFQTGAGFMVGSPYQTDEHLVNDLLFLKGLQPEMVGIGPFIHHNDTPFADYSDGTVRKTIQLVALTRLLLPKALLPSTTALASLDQEGRKTALLSGANVVMPNLTPIGKRKNYLLYQNKIAIGEETAESFDQLKTEIESIGLIVDLSRGDYPMIL
ncbi:MAG: [FeFe] hydrogenase H-cluster radical SAM maturase HydE [Ruminococcaceae bacterium]|nr:[FeFe] hydrogenase H-cluster radical SAM maturase HydE [Oscillospiraceae bacterium]